jgi:hypothetical protein
MTYAEYYQGGNSRSGSNDQYENWNPQMLAQVGLWNPSKGRPNLNAPQHKFFGGQSRQPFMRGNYGQPQYTQGAGGGQFTPGMAPSYMQWLRQRMQGGMAGNRQLRLVGGDQMQVPGYGQQPLDLSLPSYSTPPPYGFNLPQQQYDQQPFIPRMPLY